MIKLQKDDGYIYKTKIVYTLQYRSDVIDNNFNDIPLWFGQIRSMFYFCF